MPSIFDGMASVVNSVLGDPVTYITKHGAVSSVHSMFRDGPVEAIDEDGHPVIITSPSWRVRKMDVPHIARDDRIIAPNGRTYQILNVSPSGSPAADAMVICELEWVRFP